MSQKENNNRIDYIEFPAKDIEETKRFWGLVFGWDFIDYGPDYVSFYDGRLAGGFCKAPNTGTGGPLVVLYATQLESIRAKIKDAGGEIVKEIFDFPGGRRFHFTDPSGNEAAVWSDQ
ncbi:MAG: VOC family protein [bacterium]